MQAFWICGKISAGRSRYILFIYAMRKIPFPCTAPLQSALAHFSLNIFGAHKIKGRFFGARRIFSFVLSSFLVHTYIYLVYTFFYINEGAIDFGENMRMMKKNYLYMYTYFEDIYTDYKFYWFIKLIDFYALSLWFIFERTWKLVPTTPANIQIYWVFHTRVFFYHI